MMTTAYVNRSNLVETHVSSYLADSDHSLAMLNKYPLVKSPFIQFNTSLSLYAAVSLDARVFVQCRGQMENGRRNRLADCNFEKLVLLKANMKETGNI